jgi:hypothetical protein
MRWAKLLTREQPFGDKMKTFGSSRKDNVQTEKYVFMVPHPVNTRYSIGPVDK